MTKKLHRADGEIQYRRVLDWGSGNHHDAPSRRFPSKRATRAMWRIDLMSSSRRLLLLVTASSAALFAAPPVLGQADVKSGVAATAPAPTFPTLAADRQRRASRSRCPHRHAAQRHALCDHEERHPAGPGIAAPAHRCRLTDGEGRPARPRPFHGAYGVQRHHAHPEERPDQHPRTARAGVRCRSQRGDQLRPDLLPARTAAHQ